MEELKVGDRVKIADDSPLVRRVLNETFLQCPNTRIPQFGGIGYVTKIDIGTRDNRVYCMVRPIKPTGDTYGWPAILLEKLPADGAGGKAMEYAAHRIVSDYMTTMCASKGIDLSHYPPAKCRYNIQIGPDPSPSPPGVAEIVFYHVVKDGKCMLQIAEIRGIELWDDLPVEYKFGYPVMWGSRGPQGGIVIYQRPIDVISKPDREVKFCVGQLLTEEEAAKLVKRMRACGKRLHDINVASRAKADEERLERWKAKGQKVVRI